MEMVGLPKHWLAKLVAAALGKVTLSKADASQAEDLLLRLQPKRHNVSLDNPTGTAETIYVETEIHKASSIGSSPSWSVSRG